MTEKGMPFASRRNEMPRLPSRSLSNSTACCSHFGRVSVCSGHTSHSFVAQPRRATLPVEQNAMGEQRCTKQVRVTLPAGRVSRSRSCFCCFCSPASLLMLSCISTTRTYPFDPFREGARGLQHTVYCNTVQHTNMLQHAAYCIMQHSTVQHGLVRQLRAVLAHGGSDRVSA